MGLHFRWHVWRPVLLNLQTWRKIFPARNFPQRNNPPPHLLNGLEAVGLIQEARGLVVFYIDWQHQGQQGHDGVLATTPIGLAWGAGAEGALLTPGACSAWGSHGPTSLAACGISGPGERAGSYSRTGGVGVDSVHHEEE